MASDQQKAAVGPVVLRDRYAINPGAPLSEFAQPNAQAFHAEDRRDASKALFALVVRPGIPTRIDAMRALKGSDCPGLMSLVEWGTVDWPLTSRKAMVLIYARPGGGRVMSSLTSTFKAVEEPDVVRKVISPVFAALKELRSHGVVHRAIRPTNMYWATPERDRIVLGDCAIVPPAFEQPAVVEPIEMAMCHPAGRGPGSYADDIYAFGASLAMLLQGRNPTGQMDDDAVIQRKIVQGSFAVLVGEARLALQLSEILRGTLCDDPHERWDAESMELWLSGRRLSPLLAKFEKRAARAMQFANREYYTARELAMAFCRNWDAVPSIALDGRLELWVRRSLDQKDKADAVGAVVREAQLAVNEKRNTAFDILTAKLCMVLDNRAPIRYKGLSAMPDGIGALLAVTMSDGGDVRTIAEALMREVPKAYFETREAYSPENSMMATNFRDMRTYLDRGIIGFGIERVLYEMNDSMPCASPITLDDYVLEVRDLLPALNAAAKKADGKTSPVDRHVAAFIAARAGFDIERQMTDLASADAERSTMGMANLLALIQWRLGQTGLVLLATWVGSLLQPAINGFHNRDKRRELEKEIPRLVRDGSLVELSRLLDNPEDRGADAQGFYVARQEWAEARREIRDIEEGRVNHKERSQRTARQLAALLSVTVSLITITLLVLTKVF